MKLPQIVNIKRDENKVHLELYMQSELLWFKGHFESFPILPAVAMLYFVKYFAKSIFAIDVNINKIPRVKFKRAIKPDSLVYLNIEYKDTQDTIKFDYSDSGNNQYSMGTLKICKN